MARLGSHNEGRKSNDTVQVVAGFLRRGYHTTTITLRSTAATLLKMQGRVCRKCSSEETNYLFTAVSWLADGLLTVVTVGDWAVSPPPAQC